MWYVLTAIVLIVVAVLLLRLRLRAEIGTRQRWLFVGLGRTGVHADFADNRLALRWAGLNVYSRPLVTKTEPEEPQEPPEHREPPKEPSGKRRVSLSEMMDLARRSRGAIWTYLVGLLRAVTVEQLDAQIEAGFDQPHVTGQVFGYYQAALATVPSVVGRVNYVPDFTGKSFDGTVRASIALPLYKWLHRSVVLLWQLPLRDIMRVTIGSKQGDRDVE